MRRSISIFLSVSVAASIVFAATVQLQPLNVKTGLWQMTQSITWSQLPPQMARQLPQTRTFSSCVTPKDLSSNPWAHGEDDGCTWKVLSSTSSDMELQGSSCSMGSEYGMSSELHGQIHVTDPEHGTGTMTIVLTGNGMTMNGVASYQGKWVGAKCPAD